MRQFGMFQPIPHNTLFTYDNLSKQHRVSRVNRSNKDWQAEHAEFIIIWHRRLDYMQQGNHVQNFEFASDEYMNWYWPRTVLYVINPSNVQHGFQPLGETTEFLVRFIIIELIGYLFVFILS